MGHIYERLGVPTVINCVGYATRVGGSCPDDDVLQAMRDANQAYVEIDDLQAAASRLIARATGAAAGIVTCGAAAAMTLAAAACLAGNDTQLMDRLPDTTDASRPEIIYPRVGSFHYEHPVRLSGAHLIELDYWADDVLQHIESSITEKTAAIGYAWHEVEEKPRIEQLAALAHRHGLPLIVDGAMALPPVENLRGIVRRGADLVAFSGGKHLRGPQASGILCGRADLIRSAWVQMVDMDVRRDTWSLQEWVDEGWIPHPPRHGLGRAMKVGKESIAGLLVALEKYEDRDHAAELGQWHRSIEQLAEGLAPVQGVSTEKMFPAPNGQPFPVLMLNCLQHPAAATLVDRLRLHRPKIILNEDEECPATFYIYPMCLRPGEPEQIVSALRDILHG
jgi:L-seryl-tRNA(Ser) seleniumtransferase